MNDWISVKDKRPPEDVDIIVFGKDMNKVWCTQVYVSKFQAGVPIEPKVLDWTTYRDVEITHWMPLPQPPERLS